jgi:hypothetical protein
VSSSSEWRWNNGDGRRLCVKAAANMGSMTADGVVAPDVKRRPAATVQQTAALWRNGENIHMMRLSACSFSIRYILLSASRLSRALRIRSCARACCSGRLRARRRSVWLIVRL